MNVSVIICTLNRCESLKDTLESFLVQEHLNGLDYEIIVVNNNSNDDTEMVVKSYINKFSSRLRYLFEEKKGKPYALNAALKIAKGAIIAFTDDDCIVNHDFLSKIWGNFSKYGEQIAFLGGKIIPKWINCSRPSWMSDEFLHNLAMLDYGDKAFMIDGKREKRDLYGANYAFRKDVFEKHEPFKVERFYTQDIEICRRVLAAGQKGMYAPDVKVLHKVTPLRTQKHYFYHWYFKKGRMREFDREIKSKVYHPLGIPFWFILRTFKLLLKSLNQSSEAAALKYRCEFLSNVGFMVERIKHHIV